MRKYKICVYAICKNEEKFVDSFMSTACEADYVVVSDTGSTDTTIEKLRSLGAIVHSIEVNPFRFDEARQKSLDNVPDDVDICLSVDLDEILDSGWYECIQKHWQDDTMQGEYLHHYWIKDDKPMGSFINNRMHTRRGFRWIYPCHEVLECTENKPVKSVFINDMILRHFPDCSKSRNSYLPLLELTAKEYNIARSLYLLGAEYIGAGMWDKGIETLEKYFKLPDCIWPEERAASMRHMAKAYLEKGELQLAQNWLYKAIAECPERREAYIDMTLLGIRQQDYEGVLYFAIQALKIEHPPLGSTTSVYAWDATPYDMAAIACYHLGLKERALEYSKEAIKTSPEDNRLRDNHALYEQR